MAAALSLTVIIFTLESSNDSLPPILPASSQSLSLTLRGKSLQCTSHCCTSAPQHDVTPPAAFQSLEGMAGGGGSGESEII